MGKKIVCDRFGSEIIESPSGILSALNIKFPMIVAKVAVKESYVNDFYEFDLCEDCKAGLVEWIRMGKEAEA